MNWRRILFVTLVVLGWTARILGGLIFVVGVGMIFLMGACLGGVRRYPASMGRGRR
jgi:hypothetical protein